MLTGPGAMPVPEVVTRLMIRVLFAHQVFAPVYRAATTAYGYKHYYGCQ